MEGSTEVRSWLRCYRCWSQNLEVQVHYEGIHRIDPETGERGEVVDEMQEAVVQCLECMHDQPHLGFHNGRVEPIEDRWERMIAGTPWVASCTVTVDADDVETCSGPEAGDALSYAAFGDHGTREFFTHVRFHKHDEDQIVVHLLVELYSRSAEEATEVLEEAARGHAGDHLAGRGVAAAGLDRRRPALSPCAGSPATRGARQQLEHDQRQRHRHRRRQLVEHEEQQVEQPGEEQREQRRDRPLRAALAGEHRRRAARPRTGRRSPARPCRTDSDCSCGRPLPGAGAAETSWSLGACSRSVSTSHVSAAAIARIPSFSQPGGVTAASSSPRVTQHSAHSSVAAPSPHSVVRLAQASANSGAASSASHGRAPWVAQPSAAAASSGTAISAS